MTVLTGGRYHIGTGPAPPPFPAPAAFRFGENDEYVKYGHAPFASGGGGDPYWTPEIITQTWFMAERGKIPISGASYGGPFAGSGFDGFWLDMSEIVRPTRDGIHGREYISTAVDLGARPERLRVAPDGKTLQLDDCGQLGTLKALFPNGKLVYHVEVNLSDAPPALLRRYLLQ